MSDVQIHPTAIVSDSATIGEDCHIGPFCTVGDEVRLGNGVRLDSHAVVDGRTSIGDETHVFPFVSIGLAPLSFALTAPVSDLIGVRETLAIAALVPAISTFAMLFLTGMRAEETRELQAAAVGAGAGSDAAGGSGSIPTTSYTSS